MSRSILVYSLGRVAVLAVMLFLGYVVGLRGLALLAVAFLVSGLLSYFLLARQRIGMAQALSRRAERRRAATYDP